MRRKSIIGNKNERDGLFMTNKEIYQIAMEQHALEINCAVEDFLRDCPVIICSGIGRTGKQRNC